MEKKFCGKVKSCGVSLVTLSLQPRFPCLNTFESNEMERKTTTNVDCASSLLHPIFMFIVRHVTSSGRSDYYSSKGGSQVKW